MKTNNRSNYVLGLLTGACIVTVGFFTGKALGLHSKPSECPKTECNCKQLTFKEMVSIITKYGMYIDDYNYGTKEQKKVAKDSIEVYQKRYNIGL